MDRIATSDISQRFWSKVAIAGRNECWTWMASIHYKHHYGTFRLFRRMEMATRVAYWLATGEWLTKEYMACHRCDNPLCVNPNHLFKGTAYDNNKDRDNKGRRIDLRGEQHPHAKLTWADVQTIRNTTGRGSGKALAQHYGISQSEVSLIRSGKLWQKPY